MADVGQMRRAEPASDSFDDFWRNCVKKLDKALTKAKWDAITSERGLETKMLDRDSGAYVAVHLKAAPQELIDGMKRYAKSQIDPNTYRIRDNGKFTCGPAVWLNRGRWMDE